MYVPCHACAKQDDEERDGDTAKLYHRDGFGLTAIETGDLKVR